MKYAVLALVLSAVGMVDVASAGLFRHRVACRNGVCRSVKVERNGCCNTREVRVTRGCANGQCNAK